MYIIVYLAYKTPYNNNFQRQIYNCVCKLFNKHIVSIRATTSPIMTRCGVAGEGLSRDDRYSRHLIGLQRGNATHSRNCTLSIKK